MKLLRIITISGYSVIRAGMGAEELHRVLALSEPAQIRVTARFSIYHLKSYVNR